jgi:Bacteriophage head to tail connecting protein
MPPLSASPPFDVTTLRRSLDRRLASLRAERMNWQTHWRELADYILPRRGRFLATPNASTRGDQRNQKIIDSTGTLAARTLASGMMSGITSPARPWFRLTVADPAIADQDEVKIWLDEVAKRMLRVFAKSNFYNSIAVLYEELSVFGSAVMMVLEDGEDTIRCQTLTIGEYCLANSERLTVNTLYREFPMTVAQLAAEFGLEQCSGIVRSLYESGQLDREVMIGHAVEPNDGPADSDGIRGMPFRSVYWELNGSSGQVLKLSGFREFPACAPRWTVVGNDVYGRSPGMDALGDIKALQIEQKRKAQAIEKMVNPPMVADVALKNQAATLLPGGVTYLPGSAAGVGFRPVYEINPPLAGLIQDIQEVQRRIQQAFYADLWLMISQLDNVRTATEINERKEEKLLMLGPVLERLHSELLNPALKRVFGIMQRNNLLPPAPAILGGRALQVDYISMLAQVQKAVATTGIERLVSFVGNLAGAHPEVLDNIDFDEVVDQYADMLGVSPKLIAAKGKIALIRQARAASMAQLQAQNQALKVGMTAVQGAKILSETPVGAGVNALEAIAAAQ